MDLVVGGEEKKSSSAPNFECNICFEVAEEPVVTSCGHLFCWPCLYRWLHRHSASQDCPLCKGKVIESAIVPIYGRGGSSHRSSSDEKNKKKEKSIEEESGGDSDDLEIPPRPRGERVERTESLDPALQALDLVVILELDRLLELVRDAHRSIETINRQQSVVNSTTTSRWRRRRPAFLSAVFTFLRGFLPVINRRSGGPRDRERVPSSDQPSTSSSAAAAAAAAATEPNSGTTLRRERSGTSDLEPSLRPCQRRRTD